MLAAAYLLGLQLAMRRAKARGMDPNRALDLGIAIIVSALVGAKLLLVLVDFDHFRRNPGELLSIVRAGGVFYGGLIAAILVAFWYMRRHKMPLWLTTDIFAPGISLGHAVGRLGLPGGRLLLRPSRRTCRGRSPSRTRRPRPTSARRWACRCIRRSCTRAAPSW